MPTNDNGIVQIQHGFPPDRRIGLGIVMLCIGIFFLLAFCLFTAAPFHPEFGKHPSRVGRLRITKTHETIAFWICGEVTFVFGIYCVLAGARLLTGPNRWLEQLLAKRVRRVVLYFHVFGAISVVAFILFYIFAL